MRTVCLLAYSLIYKINSGRGTHEYTNLAIGRIDVPELLNVHVNETNKKICFFRRIFFFQPVKN